MIAGAPAHCQYRVVKQLSPIVCVIILTITLLNSAEAWATEDLLDNEATPDAGVTSFSIQTDKDTSKVWYQANRFEATEDGDVSQITLQLSVDSAKQNSAAAATSVQIHSNDSNNELEASLATFAYDSHSLVSTTGSRDDIRVTYTGTASLTTDTYWLATYSDGDRDTDDEGASLPYSDLSSQVYEGPWRWVSGEQNRYSQAVTSSYTTINYAPLAVISGVRTNPPAPESVPSNEGADDQLSTPTTLTLMLPAGVQCTSSPLTASGPWMQLPSADECSATPRAGAEGDPTLLGWATNPNLPVEIAERQVANGWGAYETFSDDGQLTGVFIPAGGYAAVTGDTNLYPIWSE